MDVLVVIAVLYTGKILGETRQVLLGYTCC